MVAWTKPPVKNKSYFITACLLETCRCAWRLTTTWRLYEPYVGISNGTKNPGGILPSIVEDMAVTCCQTCKAHGYSFVDFTHNGKNESAERRDAHELKHFFDGVTDFYFPVYGHKGEHFICRD